MSLVKKVQQLRSKQEMDNKDIAGATHLAEIDPNEQVPLLSAVEAGNQTLCRELLSLQTAEQLMATTTNGDTALHLATRRRDVGIVRMLVDYGTNVNTQNGEGQTSLHIAAAEGDEALLNFFHGVRASASIVDNLNRTPMHLAAENGHAHIIKILADKFKANIYERTKDGSTLMHVTSLNGHTECTTMLLKMGLYLHMSNKTGIRSIHTAARFGHVGIIKTLIQRGEKVDIVTNDNYTALHIAVESSMPAVVETLLGYGADVHARAGRLRETPLHIAARVKDGDGCAAMLLKCGARPNFTTDDGRTPVHVAAANASLSCLMLLLEDGGDAMFESHTLETPLHLASGDCQPEIVRLLIDVVKVKYDAKVLDAYINGVNENGATALHYICNVTKENVRIPKSDTEIVRTLLENGADVTIQTKQTQETAFHFSAVAGNNNVFTEMLLHIPDTDIQNEVNRQSSVGRTPLMIACNLGHMELVTNMLANHARVDVFDIECRSALHLAAEHGFLHVSDALLTNRAFINSKSRVGTTPLHLAAMNGFTHLVKYLIQDHNAVIDILTLRKQTPLHLAAANGQIEVCKLLLELGASFDATDDLGQKPIHVAANSSEVVNLFLQQQPNLLIETTKDGNTCAHIAAIKGSVKVMEELMKFDQNGVITARNKLTYSTPLQLAAKGGHVDVVEVLVGAGASCTDENKDGFTAVHLAAQNGHCAVLAVLRTSNSLKVSSEKLGLTPLHVAAYYGQTDTIRELLTYVPATVKSELPSGNSLVSELGSESGLTPLHLASYSGNENVVRLLLNVAGVKVDSVTKENGYNPLHLSCFRGHLSVVGLLLSRSAALLQSVDFNGKTGLHIAAMHGHYQMVEMLLGQGAEINAADKYGWTSLHCAAKAGHLEVVKLLCGSGASSKSETNNNLTPIWFAASEGHNNVFHYLMHKEHDTYSMMEDENFLCNLMILSQNHNNKPIEEFVLVSPAPVDIAAKLSNIYTQLSTKQKERANDLIAAGKQCETMTIELLELAAGVDDDSSAKILTATDRQNTEFLDVLIENEQKEVIAHTVVQKYLQELWRGNINWSVYKLILLLFAFIICPPVWVIFTLPLGHNFNKLPIIKFMSHLTSHIFLMLHLIIVSITPLYPVLRPSLSPYWYEWGLFIMLIGLLLFELSTPRDKSGLGSLKLLVLLFGMAGIASHVSGMFFIHKAYWPTLLYCRNQFFAFSFLLTCVQILDFLSFHHLFGPWGIIIGDLLKDLARFVAVLAIFMFGFSMHIVALNQPFRNMMPHEVKEFERNQNPNTTYFTDVRMNPIQSFELMFFAIFGQITSDGIQVDKMPPNNKRMQPDETDYLFKIVFSVYMLVSVIVLVNLLIAMMSDTYQRIQAQSVIEWKFGLSKLIRNMHRTTTPPPPINLITFWVMWLLNVCKTRSKRRKKRHSLVNMMGARKSSPERKAGEELLRKDSAALSVVRLSSLAPLESEISFGQSPKTRIERVADWETISKKYRALNGGDAIQTIIHHISQNQNQRK